VDVSGPDRYRPDMDRWVALLRGVNVNGITIRSAELAELFRGLGFDDVRTVLASGNVVFSADVPAEQLKTSIEQGLRDRFGSDDGALDALVADLELDESVEQVTRGDGVVYWSCPKGSSTDTVFAKRAVAARFKHTTTTRNTNTLRKLL
jgi:uncharacterized protein (DUF1697 family)